MRRELRVEDREGVRLATLSRPEVLNAFDVPLYTELHRAMEETARSDELAVFVLTGEGRAFSSGADLSLLAGDPDPAGEAGRSFQAFIEGCASFPKPFLGAVNGLAVGVGVTLLAYCDLVFVSEEARLRCPFAALGVAPEAGSSVTLPARMGWQPAAWALFTGEWIDADQAVAWGLAFRKCPPRALLDETLAVARRIAALPLASLVETKRLLIEGRPDAVRAARAREDAAFRRLLASPAHRAALAALRGA